MRRFLSRSRSAPLPSQWASSEKAPSLSPVDCPPQYSGQVGSIASEDAIDKRSAGSIAMPVLPTPPPSPIAAHTSSSRPSPTLVRRDTVDASLTPQSSPCFTITRRPSNADYAGSAEPSRVVIHDPYLQTVCRKIIQVPLESFEAAESLEVDLGLLLGCFPRFAQYLDTLRMNALHPEHDPTRKAVSALTDYLRTEHRGTLAKIADLTSKGEITFDTLFAIFVPGVIVTARCADTGERCAYELKSATKVSTPSAEVYDLICESVDVADDTAHCACCTVRRSASAGLTCSTGARSAQGGASSGPPMLRRMQRRILVPDFRGSVQICSLDVYPLTYHPDAGKLEASLAERGRRWLTLQGIRHVQYNGPAVCTVSVGGCKTLVKYDVKSFVLLDRRSFFRLNPDCGTAHAMLDSAKGLYDPSNYPETLVLAPPILYGFSVSHQRWLVFNVEHVQPNEFDNDIIVPAKYECDSSQAEHMTRAEGIDPSIEQPPIGGKGARTAARASPITEQVGEALRTAKRDTAADVQRLCKEELSAFSASFEERCVQIFAQVNAKYAAEYALHRQIMRTVLIVIGGLVIPALILLLYRLLAPPARATRWSGPMHFTISILSPFSSVVEHESSSFGLRQVILLCFAAGLFFMFWLRFCVRRK